MDDLPSRFQHLLSEQDDSVRKRGKTLLAEWIIDSIVHPVTGHNEVWFQLHEHPIQSFVQVRPRKFASGMARLRKTGDSFTRQSDIDKLELPFRELAQENGFNIVDVMAAIGDAVAKKNNPLGIRNCIRARAWAWHLLQQRQTSRER